MSSGKATEAKARTLTVYLLSHNRIKTAIEAAETILKQSDNRFRFIVSDSSESLDDQSEIDNFCNSNHIQLRKRSPHTSLFDHWWICVEECTTDYLIIFHDDDLMLPNFVKEFWEFESRKNYFAAVGFNALISNRDNTVSTSFASARPILGPISPGTLVDSYFLKFSQGIAPFPSYVYVSKNLKRPGKEVGKYSDVAILFELAAEGKLYWVNKRVMTYHLHSDNYGLSESLTDWLRLLAFMKRQSDWFSKFNLLTYRYFLYRKIQRKRHRSLHPTVRIMIILYPIIRAGSVNYWLNLLCKKFVRVQRTQ